MADLIVQLVAALKTARIQIVVDRSMYVALYKEIDSKLSPDASQVLALYDARLKQIDEALAAAGVTP